MLIKTIVRWIPNTITCLNLLSGALACVFAFHATESFGSLTGMELSWILIGAAAVFDFCDGAAARLLRAYSELGKELDSLSDLVSFGLAPAMLLLNVTAGLTGGSWEMWSALIIPVMGALRLARFNIDDSQTTSFKGLPIPANAIFWIGATAWLSQHGPVNSWLMAAVTVAVALTMVCGMRMFSLKFKNFALKDNAVRYLQLICTIVAVIIWGVSGLAAAMLLYMLLSAATSRRR